MSISLYTTSARARRWLGLTMSLACVAGLFVAPGIASAGDDDSDKEMIAKVIDVRHKFIEAFNAKKWDELGALYLDDAVAIPPNHEPIEGRAAIAEYFKSIRDAVGEGHCDEPFKFTVSGKFVAAVGHCAAYSGRLGFNTHELFEQQDDGSLLFKFDMFGLR